MKFERFGLGILKGMALTLKHLFRRPITTQYPEERLTVSRRIRGYELIWSEERCTGCATCAKSCPQGAIEIVTSSPKGDRYPVDKFTVDSGYCIFCGLCVESCPYEALALGLSYERAQYRRVDMVLSKEALQLSDIRQPSGYSRPKVEATLPRQSLLVYGDKDKEEGGQKLDFLNLSKKRGRGV